MMYMEIRKTTLSPEMVGSIKLKRLLHKLRYM